MLHLNVEIKARCLDIDTFERTLRSLGASFHGVDHQLDTYFQVAQGRLKLREGNIENALIHYAREDDSTGPKKSYVTLYQLCEGASELKNILSNSIGILAVVDKRRKIFFIDNVKFHIDTVEHLGTFVEIEAMDHLGDSGPVEFEQLKVQCDQYLEALQIHKVDLISHSYSDMILENTSRL